MSLGFRISAVIVVHHAARALGQILLCKGMLRPVIVDKRDDACDFIAYEVNLLAEGLLLRGDHRWCVIPHLGGEVEWIH